MEMLTYFNIIALFIFSWYTIDADTNQTIITNVFVSITFIQLTAVIVYHVYKHMNKNLFATIQVSLICIKIKQLTSKIQKRHSNTDIYQLHGILDYFDRPPAINNDHKVFQIQPKSTEPTTSIIELQAPQLAPATPPHKETIEEESELESEQQASEQDGISMIPITEENLAIEIKKNKQCINNYSGIQMAACNEIGKNFKTKTENSTSLEENSIPQSDSNAQINGSSLKGIKQANKGASTRQLPAVSGLEEGVGSQCIIVKAEVHDY